MKIVNFKQLITIAVTALVLGGCAVTPQLPVTLAPSTLSESPGKIGVLFAPVPKADTYFPGANCLLCLATASVMHTSLSKHVQSFDGKELSALQQELITVMRRRGLEVIDVTPANFKIDDLPKATKEGVNFAKYDFSKFSKQHSLTKILVVNISSFGVTRNFASYIPTGAPFASVSGVAYIVNTSTNAYEWYQPLLTTKTAEGEWDQVPDFPKLSNALYQAFEMFKDEVKQPFVK